MNRPVSIAEYRPQLCHGKRQDGRVHSLHLLSVGPALLGDIARDAVMARHSCRLTVGMDYRDLWAIPATRSIDVAVLHPSLLPFELEDSCRLIRRRWPRARIVIIRPAKECIDAALYDERLVPSEFPAVLLKCVEKPLTTNAYTDLTMRCDIRALSSGRQGE